MPNGGDPKECDMVEPFYEQIRPTLEQFSAKYDLEFIPWYHEDSCFLLDSPKARTLGFLGVARSIQVHIKPQGDGAVVIIDAAAFSDVQERRLRTFSVFKGQLPLDKDRLEAWLEASRAILAAISDRDLLSVEEWKKREKLSLSPLCG